MTKMRSNEDQSRLPDAVEKLHDRRKDYIGQQECGRKGRVQKSARKWRLTKKHVLVKKT